MPVRRLFTATLISLLAVVVPASVSSRGIPKAGSVEILGKSLEAGGLRVAGPMPTGLLSSNCFSVPSVKFEASGETVLAYEARERHGVCRAA
jgi:hypothetical protein